MARLRWYKRDPEAALNGMMALTLEERGAYNTILDLMYSRDGSVPDDAKFLCRWLGCDVRVWKRIRQRLLDLGKLEMRGNFLHNFRVSREVPEANLRIEVLQTLGSKYGGQNRKNNELEKPPTLENERTAHSIDKNNLDNNTSHALPNPAREVVELFDRVQHEIYNGERRAFPAGDDIVFATRWIEAQVPMPALEGLFRAKLQARKVRGQQTIGSLKFLDGAVAELVAGKSRAPIPAPPKRKERPQAGAGLAEMRDQIEKQFGSGS